MDFVLARTNMINSQIRPNRIMEGGLLSSLMQVERERFVPAGFRDFAYSDFPIPLGQGERRMLKPIQVAWLVQAMNLVAGERLLVVGGGTGYEVAVLASMGMRVFALESDPDLVSLGRTLTESATVTWRVGDLALGWPEESPFDGVLFTGSVPLVPNKPIGQLGKNGRLVAVVGAPAEAVMQAVRMVGISGGDRPEILFETVAAPLPGLAAAVRFEL